MQIICINQNIQNPIIKTLRSDGWALDDRDEALRPYKVGDTITYTSPCDDGANVYWYPPPTSGGSATLIRTAHLRCLT